MQSNVHVLFDRSQTIVVELDIGMKQIVTASLVTRVSLPSFSHLLTAEVRHIRVVNLNIPASGLVQQVNFLVIRRRNVCKVLLIVLVHVSGVSVSVLVSQVVPLRSRKRDLNFLPITLRRQALHVFILGHVDRLAFVADLARAYNALAGIVAALDEGREIGHVCSEH